MVAIENSAEKMFADVELLHAAESPLGWALTDFPPGIDDNITTLQWVPFVISTPTLADIVANV
jgi:hypothetical protein